MTRTLTAIFGEPKKDGSHKERKKDSDKHVRLYDWAKPMQSKKYNIIDLDDIDGQGDIDRYTKGK